MAVASGVRPEQNGGDGTLCALFSLSLLISVSPYIILYTYLSPPSLYIYVHAYVRAIRPSEMLHVRCASVCACDNNNINPRGKKGRTRPSRTLYTLYIHICYVHIYSWRILRVLYYYFKRISFLSPLFALF